MSIAPARLQRVTADNFEAGEFKTCLGVTHVRAHDVAEHIRFAAARRARTRAAQKLQIEERLCPVVPLNGQLIPDLLNIRRLQTHMSILQIVDLSSNIRAWRGTRCSQTFDNMPVGADHGLSLSDRKSAFQER